MVTSGNTQGYTQLAKVADQGNMSHCTCVGVRKRRGDRVKSAKSITYHSTRRSPSMRSTSLKPPLLRRRWSEKEASAAPPRVPDGLGLPPDPPPPAASAADRRSIVPVAQECASQAKRVRERGWQGTGHTREGTPLVSQRIGVRTASASALRGPAFGYYPRGALAVSGQEDARVCGAN